MCAPPCPSQRHSQQPRCGTCLTSIDGCIGIENVVYTYNGIVFSFQKEGSPAVCDNMDEFGGHYAKWIKTGTDGQI